MSWFDGESKVSNLSRKDHVAKIKYKQIIADKANFFHCLTDKNIEKDVQYRIVTSKSFNALCVIEFIDNNYVIDEIFIAVYRMNSKATMYLHDFIERGININIAVSDFFRENKRYERWCHDLIRFAEKYDNVSVKFVRSHAKVFLCKTECGKYIVFEGSGNLSDNSRIEQYLLEDSPKMYEFHKKWIMELTDE